MFGSDLFDQVLSDVKRWLPTRNYSSETGYRDDLAGSLRQSLQAGGAFGFEGARHSVQGEAGRHLADIAVDQKIGLELKMDLKKQAEVDRLVGQVERFLKEYEGVIVVLVGTSNEDKIDELQPRLRGLTDPGFMGSAKRVSLVIKKPA